MMTPYDTTQSSSFRSQLSWNQRILPSTGLRPQPNKCSVFSPPWRDMSELARTALLTENVVELAGTCLGQVWARDFSKSQTLTPET